MNVAILGAGGHGYDIAAIAEALGHEVTFYDDRKTSGRLNTWALPQGAPFTVGVNDPATRRRLAGVGTQPVTLVHPTATVDPSALLGKGVVVGPNSYIGPWCVLDDHVHVGAGCTLTRTSVLACTTIAPGVDIAGDCVIGRECLIGVGARVRNLLVVGQRSVVGAGAVVVDHVPSDVTVAGVPARELAA